MAMLCCVSRKAAGGADDVGVGSTGGRSRASLELSRFVEVCRDLGKIQQQPENEALRRLDEAVLGVAAVANTFVTFRKLDTLPEEALDAYQDAQPEVLLPCGVCGRKFNPRSLEKHVKICERTATKKRKPFDSAKQRIQGTELAEFLPKQQQHNPESRRPSGPSANGPSHAEERACRRPNNAWKQTRDEFLRAIRAARGDNHTSQPQSHSSQQHQHHQHQQHQQSHQQHGHSGSSGLAQRPSTLSLVSSPGAPTRANEKGQCPTCQRQFGLKSYDRHVAFCRERATRLPASPQIGNNVAKERLEARMRYRAPALRNRRPTNREKYSPGHRLAPAGQPSPLLARSPVKDTASSATTTPTSATTPSTVKAAEAVAPKLPVLSKRPGQTNKESPAATSGPLKSRPIIRSNSGASKDYDPFLLAEQQFNDLFSDTSDQSSTDGSSICPSQKPNSSPNFPLSLGSAFAKYPNCPKPQSSPASHSTVQPCNGSDKPQPQQQQQQQQPRRLSLIAPPMGFDDLTSSDLSSDCTETNSLSRELPSSSCASSQPAAAPRHATSERELGRRLIIDQSQALGGGEFAPASDHQQQPKPGPRPAASRSNSLRSASAPRPPERKISSSSSSGSSSSDFARVAAAAAAKPKPPGHKGGQQQQQRSAAGNGCHKPGANGSSLSLSSIISDAEIKRSNMLLDELLSSFEEDGNSSSTTLPSLMSLMRNETSLTLLSSSAGSGQQQQNGVNGHRHPRAQIGNGAGLNCSDDDAELSSPESVKRQECGKLSADSAYSSLNRKYSNHGRSTNDVNGGNCKYKLSKFCHECGFKFPDSAKFCCECGVKRLTL